MNPPSHVTYIIPKRLRGVNQGVTIVVVPREYEAVVDEFFNSNAFLDIGIVEVLRILFKTTSRGT